ncbi:hypothetical protein CG447_03180 [Faecalibacterium duncaniae]|nr:hypothetical protein CG447_03180 [Faecalibacterium duncaniae]
MSRSCGERASSPQAAYHSLPPDGESSLAPLRLLSPQSKLCGGPCWEHAAGMGQETFSGRTATESKMEGTHER